MAHKNKRLRGEAEKDEIAYLQEEHLRLIRKAFRLIPSQAYSPARYKQRLAEGVLNNRDNLMARIKSVKEAINTQFKKLDPPFPSPPQRPPKYSIYFHQGNSLKYVGTFAAKYSAKKFLNVVVGDNDIRWNNSNQFTSTEVTVKCEGYLEDLMEYELKPAEEQWELPEPFASEARYLNTGRHAPKVAPSPPPHPNEKVSPPKEGTNRRAQVSRDGLIPLATICAEIKVDPREARQILRKSMDKPTAGWAFSPDEAKKIKGLLKP